MPDASRVVLSYPEDLSNWGRRQLQTTWFVGYLQRTLEEASEGDEREEFLDTGCCGDSIDVPLRIERLEGGDRVGPDTEVVYEEREPGGVDGGWRVQSAGGPRA